MTNALRCLVVDDNNDFRNGVGERIKTTAGKRVAFLTASIEDISKAIAELGEYRAALRKRTAKPPLVTVFDDADVVLVDFDLLELESHHAMTGEDLAYLLRCYTSAGIVVLMNPGDIGDNFFDLTLRRSSESCSDFVVGATQVADEWLWSEKHGDFAPWGWFNLLESAKRRQAQIAAIHGKLDVPIDQVLDLRDADLALIDADTRAAIQALSPHSKPAGGASASRRQGLCCTVREFAESFVDKKDRDGLRSDAQAMTRIAAARLANWCEHAVLPCQSAFVDAPHVVARLPGLLAADGSRKAALEKVCVRTPAAAESIDPKANLEVMISPWFSRPVWRWADLSDHESFFDWAAPSLDGRVFAENRSAFVERARCDQFKGPPPANFAYRFLDRTGLPSMEYVPAARLSM